MDVTFLTELGIGDVIPCLREIFSTAAEGVFLIGVQCILTPKRRNYGFKEWAATKRLLTSPLLREVPGEKHPCDAGLIDAPPGR